MKSRRKFLIIGGITVAGSAILFRHPISKALKWAFGDGENEDLIIEADHYAEVIRPGDFMNLRFYFINLIPKGGMLKKIKGQEDLPSFFIVRLPQQHFAEEYKDLEFDEECTSKFPFPQRENYSKSLAAGFSYLTFKLPKKHDSIPYSAEALLNWNAYELITLQELSTYPADIPQSISAPDNYPLIPENTPKSLLLSSTGGLIVPVSLIEVPRKMFLSPIHPRIRPASDTDYRFQFSSGKNEVYNYLQRKGPTNIILNALWNNDLVFQATGKDQATKWSPPNFKIVAYNKLDEFTNILPDGPDRERLSLLTNVPGDKRDIESKYFNISSLGSSAYLSYFNLSNTVNGQELQVIGYKQEIKLGRDNYTEISKKAIDVRSGLKLIYTEIAERRVEGGRSLLVHRWYFSYLEKEKKYDDGFRFNNYVFKKIKALSQGTFFTKIQLGALSVNDSWVVASECGPQLVIKMPYEGIDVSGHVINFELDVAIITEAAFKPDYFDKVSKLLNKRIADFQQDHEVKLNKVKIAYVPPPDDSVTNSAGNQRNNELVTESLQFYSTYEDVYESDYPIIPNLKYAEVYIPQLEGIQAIPETYLVNYAKTFIDNGMESANKTKVFLQTLDKDFKIKEIVSSKFSEVQNEVTRALRPICDVFSRYYKNIGSLVNPDIIIDNLSVLQQGISFTEKMNDKIDDIKNLNPADILRGINAEIMGGIDLKKILKNIIPFAELPVFQVLDHAAEGFSLIPEFANEYQNLANSVKGKVNDLRGLQDRLRNLIPLEDAEKIKSYIDKLGEKNSKSLQMLIISGKKVVEGIIEDNEAFYFSKTRIQDLLAEKRKKLQEEFLKLVLPDDLNIIKEKILGFFGTDLPIQIMALKQVILKIEKEITILNQSAKAGLSGVDQTRLDKLTRMLSGMNMALTTNNFLGAKYQALATEYRNRLGIELRLIQHHAQAIGVLLSDQLNKLIAKELTLPPEIINYELPDKTKLGDLLQGEKIIGATNKFKITTDISPWTEMLQQNAEKLQQNGEQWVQLFKLQLNVFDELMETTTDFTVRELYKIQNEFEVLKNQVSQNVVKAVNDLGEETLRKFSSCLLVKDLYSYFQSLYLQFRQVKDLAETLSKQYGSLDSFLKPYMGFVDTMEQEAKRVLTAQLTSLKSDLEVAAQNELQKALDEIGKLPLKDTEAYFQKFKETEILLKNQANGFFRKIDQDKQRLLEQIDNVENELNLKKDELAHFLKNKLIKLEENLKTKNTELIEAYKQGEAAVQKVLKEINTIKDYIEKIRSIDKKEINYTWSTDKFDDVSLGILKFIKGKQASTTLNVEIKNTLHFNIEKFPPILKSREIYSNTELRNFSINFLSLLTLEFDKVSFTGGNIVSEKFDVAIKNVRFDGPLNFVQVFQSYLKTLDKGLRLDISAAGATLGYDLMLPDISGGAFNFVNAALSMELRLPFRAGVPMRFIFGLNSPGNLFLLSAGIFGGRGCFQIGVEPKRGVVMIRLIIEFGGVLYLNIGVAKGIVYLFAGIYINKEYDRVELNGYLTCGGALDVLHLITASVTFYMGLRGNGKYMEGYCTVTVKIKICALVTISVGLGLYKRIYGSTDDSRRSGEESPMLGNSFVRQNVKRSLNEDETMGGDLEGPPTVTEADWRNIFEAYYPQ